MENRVQYFAFVLCLILIGCQQQINPESLKSVNGYWEIDYVKLADGSRKSYKINETIDYFELKGDQGFRKKLQPQLGGKYIDYGLTENFSTQVKDNKAYIRYETQHAKWSEEVLSVSNDELVVKNDLGIEYHYRRPVPFTVK